MSYHHRPVSQLVLQVLARGPVTIAQIAIRTGVSRSRVHRQLQKLIAAGAVVPEGPQSARTYRAVGGRRG